MFQGYLVFDTLYSLVFFKHIGSLPFLVHHALGFLCCGFGLYYHKMAVFGMATQVPHPLPFSFLSSNTLSKVDGGTDDSPQIGPLTSDRSSK
jgi:hypothetical protein